jgi:hypothetical protein
VRHRICIPLWLAMCFGVWVAGFALDWMGCVPGVYLNVGASTATAF